MKKSKVIGLALALALTAVPGVSSFVPFSPTTDTTIVSAARCGVYKVTTKDEGAKGALILRDAPGGNRIGSIPKNAYVSSDGTENGNWLHVYYNGQSGWASKTYLTWWRG